MLHFQENCSSDRHPFHISSPRSIILTCDMPELFSKVKADFSVGTTQSVSCKEYETHIRVMLPALKKCSAELSASCL